jgi:serine/threonine-protein kinase
MSDDARKLAIESARALEKRGELDQAVHAYLRAGAVEEAARALAGAKRYADAGRLVMESLGVAPALVGELDADKKRLAMKAAACFAQAGDARKAAELLVALGDLARAAEVIERAGDLAEAARIRARMGKPPSGGGTTGSEMAGAAARAAANRLEAAGQLEPAMQQFASLRLFGDAARIAYKLRRFLEAAQYFQQAGMAFEAAACFAEGGDRARCFAAVVGVPREHPKYRVAAAQAIRLALEQNPVDPRFDAFIAAYVAAGPKDERDLETFYALAKHHVSRGSLSDARAVLRKITAVQPTYRDASAYLARLDLEAKRAEGNAQGPASAKKSDDEFFPDLPDLPPPPVAPPKAQKTAYIAPMSGQFSAVRAPTRSNPGFEPNRPPAALAPATGTLPMPGEIAPGAMIADRYRIDAKIGQGGMAAVYRAHDLELGEDIAMKLFLQPSEDAQLVARFKQELTLSRGLSHPNIVRLYDIGQHQGCRFLTMELLQGTDLGAIINGKPLELSRGLRYLVQACAALALAHDKGVIHRDIKPANFFITREDILKVMDFGIAKKSAAPAAMTQAGFIAGTPAYMSPEQINNFSAVSHRTDIYALGVVAYEIFTGVVPFDHDEMMQLLMMHLTATPQPPRARNPHLPVELDEIISSLLEKDPAKRIQSCHELGARFEKLLK